MQKSVSDYINESYGLSFNDEVTELLSRGIGKGLVKNTEVNVKIKRLTPDAKLPTQGTAGAAGWDLYAAEDVVIAPGETAKIPLGFAVELPPDYAMFIVPRSGVSLRTKLRQPNSVGVIDSDYRGEVAMMFDNTEEKKMKFDDNWLARDIVGRSHKECAHYRWGTYLIRKHDRIAQAVIQRVPTVQFTEVAELSDTARGASGFGSTGTV